MTESDLSDLLDSTTGTTGRHLLKEHSVAERSAAAVDADPARVAGLSSPTIIFFPTFV